MGTTWYTDTLPYTNNTKLYFIMSLCSCVHLRLQVLCIIHPQPKHSSYELQCLLSGACGAVELSPKNWVLTIES